MTRLGDAFLEFCVALYVSRLAWERGHWLAVSIIWAFTALTNFLWDRLTKQLESLRDEKRKSFYAKLREKVEAKR